MDWCDFCERPHDGETFDVDAAPPLTLQDACDGLTHAATHGAHGAIAHRCADQYLIYALIAITKSDELSERKRKLILEIVGRYQSLSKKYVPTSGGSYAI